MHSPLDRLAGFVGLCTRAGQLIFGQEACVTAVRNGQAALVLLDESSSPNTLKRFSDTCQSHPTPLYLLPSGLLEQAVGKDGRKVASIRPGGMAQKLLSILAETPPQNIAPPKA